MFERYLSKSVHYDESVIKLLRPSWVHYRWQLFGYGMLFIAACFFLYPLQTLGAIGWIIFFACVLVALFGIFKAWLQRSLTAFIVTNQRIVDIDQTRLFERHVSECTLENIRDIRYNKTGVFHMLANVGTVRIETGGEGGHLECQDVHDPDAVKELLTRVHHHNKK